MAKVSDVMEVSRWQGFWSSLLGASAMSASAAKDLKCDAPLEGSRGSPPLKITALSLQH